MNNRYSFIGGNEGAWRVSAVKPVRRAGLDLVGRLHVVNDLIADLPAGASWMLRGLVSNVRYATRNELDTLQARQPPLNRPEARCAALIPIKKSNLWWSLAQDERRALFEEVSRHTAIGLEYLPAIARRLHHSRDLDESFDFVTWFEYAPEQADAFEELVGRLRATQEWNYVEREVDIRLERVMD